MYRLILTTTLWGGYYDWHPMLQKSQGTELNPTAWLSWLSLSKRSAPSAHWQWDPKVLGTFSLITLPRKDHSSTHTHKSLAPTFCSHLPGNSPSPPNPGGLNHSPRHLPLPAPKVAEDCCRKTASQLDWDLRTFTITNLSWILTQDGPSNYFKSPFS